MAIRYPITLSTTEPNNDTGILKIRQADEKTQTLVVQITENGEPKSYEGLQVFFCAKLGQSLGLGIVEQKLNIEEMTAPKSGKFEYTFRQEDWQKIGRQTGYFSFRRMKDDHEYTEQFTTRDFYFTVSRSVFSDGVTEVKKNGSTYIWTIEDLIRLFNDYIASGKTDWQEFVDQNREILESVDPGGKLLKEIIEARKPDGESTFGSIGERMNYIDKKTLFFNTENELTSSKMLEVNDVAFVRGRNSVYDGGNRKYLIVSEVTDLALENGLFASELYDSRIPYKFLGASIPLKYKQAEIGLTITELFEKLKKLNVNTVSICPHLWMDNATSSILGFKDDDVVTSDYISDICAKAKAADLKVLLKVHTVTENYNSYASIKPADTTKFLNQYSDKIVELFEKNHKNIDFFSITNEMDNQTNSNKDIWLSLINKLRSINESVKLLNASRVADLETNVFLEKLDYLGVNFYAPIGGDLNTPPQKHIDNLFKSTNYLNSIFEKALELGKQVLITEIGTQPYLDGLKKPEVWSHSGTMNYEYQSKFYDIVLKTLIDSDLVDGTMIFIAASAPGDGSFGFVGNSSEDTVKKIFGGSANG